VLPVGSIVSDVTSGAGLMAASIAIFGFLLQSPAALAGRDDEAVRVATVVGGLLGFGIAVTILVVGYLLW
jgi:hypothetical protein